MRIIFTIPILVLMSCIAAGTNRGSPTSLNKFQAEFLNRINQLRASGCKCGSTFMPPTTALTWNNFLENSAFNHARDMARRKYFSHTSPSGKTIKNRLEEAGYTLSNLRSYAYGENIAAGQKSISQVMDSWIKSEGHCKNIMNSKFREIGAAQTNGYWVQDFGMRLAKN
jgi:uncharacterized protein YkwD